jgi:ubiquitin carboxyl-terminal hydrolase 34
MKDFESATSHSDIFPLGQPFKSLYAVHALREYIAIRTQKVSILRKFPCMMISSLFEKGSVEETALARAISLIVAAISDRDVLDHCGSDELRDFLALHLIDSFVNLLKGTCNCDSTKP